MKTKFSIQPILRSTIRNIKPYSSARDEFTGTASVFLDANENSFGSVGISNRNRYPDPHQKELKQIIASQKQTTPAQLFLGNGSDEAIDLVFRAFCEPGSDNVLIMPPTYGMYQVCADVNGTPVKKVQLSANFQINTNKVLKTADEHTKVIFICSPNNPTANVFNEKDICHIIENFHGIVVIDEAYADFSSHKSWTEKIDNYPNLIVLQTFSKAWGLANIRLGMAFANKEIIDVFDKIKLPYNINGLTQDFAEQALEQYGFKQNLVKTIIEERIKLTAELKKFDFVEKIYPSETNFLLIKVEKPKKVYEFLIRHDIVVRDRSNQPLCEGCLRITVGKPGENDLLLTAFEYLQTGDNYRFQHLEKKKQELKRNNAVTRQAEIKRQTKETKIYILLKLDNSNPSEISTGLHFFDHMLDQLIRHSGSSAIIKVQGDLQVDEHHTIEDTALALGQAFSKALGDKRGIERYGFLLPMDDSQAQVALDFSGRPWFIWDVNFTREKVGDVPTEMVEHFFKSFSDASKCNLHIKAWGKNEHHKIEAIFKAVAKSIKTAVKQDKLNMQLPSTKGLL